MDRTLVGARRRIGRRGFTLIELLVVITIIGILASVAIPQLTGVVDDSKKKSGRADAVALHVAFTRLLWSGGGLPATITDYAQLKTAVASYLNLPPSEAEANFTFGSYTKNSNTSFTLTIKAKDQAQTTFTITENGVS